MSRNLLFVLVFGAGAANAQTTLDITLPSSTLCSYTTGAVTSGTIPGHLQAIANTASPGCSGDGGSSTALTFGPASPLTPSATTLPTNTGTVNFSFLALNATNCTGSITGVGGAFNGGSALCGGGSATSCTGTSLISVPATFTNSSTTATANYTVTATCNGATGSKQSIATVTVPAKTTTPPPGCPNITNTGASPAFFSQWTGPHIIKTSQGISIGSVDVTKFSALYGSEFPGNSGASLYIPIPQYNYLSLQFKVPDGFFAGLVPGSFGDFTFNQASSGWGTQVATTVSTACGDFSDPATQPGSTVVPGCRIAEAYSGAIMQYRRDDGCQLHDGQTYYFNVIPATFATGAALPGGGGSASSNGNLNSVEKCSAGVCSTPIQNGPQCQPNNVTKKCDPF